MFSLENFEAHLFVCIHRKVVLVDSNFPAIIQVVDRLETPLLVSFNNNYTIIKTNVYVLYPNPPAAIVFVF